MKNLERKLIDDINGFYNSLDKELTDDQKMLFETGVANGIVFILSELHPVFKIDLSILGQYEAPTNDN